MFLPTSVLLPTSQIHCRLCKLSSNSIPKALKTALIWFPVTVTQCLPNGTEPTLQTTLVFVNKTVKLEQGCVCLQRAVAFTGQSIFAWHQIKKKPLNCLCCPQDSLVFTNNWATDSVIITVHVLSCCYHHYPQTLPLWYYDVSAHSNQNTLSSSGDH